MKKLILVLIILAIPSLLKAQHWTFLKTPFQYDAQAPYFINTDTGFVYESAITVGYGISIGPRYTQYGAVGMARTTDGGLTWTVLHQFDETGITQVYFVSSTHGFAAAASNSISATRGGLYETDDAGLTWKSIAIPVRDFTGVYAAGHSVFASSLYMDSVGVIQGSSLFESFDDGITWKEQKGKYQFVYGNKDSLVASVDFSSGNPFLIYSSDLGRHWMSSKLTTSGWRTVLLYVLPHTCKIIRQYLDSRDLSGDTYSFLESDLGSRYTTWKPSLLHEETGGFIAGDACTLYLSNAIEIIPAKPKAALFRSSNQGISWMRDSTDPEPDFTELDDIDFRNLCVLHHGALIFANEGSSLGSYVDTGIWKSTDGGDGAITAQASYSSFDHKPFTKYTDTLIIPTCGSDSIVTYYATSLCTYAKPDSIWLTGIDPSEYQQRSTHHVTQCGVSPDTTVFIITPKQRGNRSITITARFVDDDFQTFEKSLHLTLSVPDAVSPELSTTSANLGELSTCDSRDTTIVITNPNCDFLTLREITLLRGREFSLNTIALPQLIAPHSTDAFRVRYGSHVTGSFFDSIVAIFGIGNQSFIDTIPVEAVSTSFTSLTLPGSPLEAGAQSFCTGDTTLDVTITRNGCDTLVLSSIFLEQEISFSLVDSIGNSLILPESSKAIRVRFRPRVKGEQYDTLRVAWHLLNDNVVRDTAIDLEGFGLSGTRLIAATPPAIDLGSIYMCESRDTTIVLTNPGCDTLHVTNGSFSNASLTSSTTYPDTMPPGGSLTITIHADTSGTQGASTISGSYFAQSDAQNSISDIPITFQVIPPVHLVLQIVPPQSGGNRQKVTYLIRVVGPHPSKLFSAFYFDLIHNDDLLSFDTAIGDGLSVVNDPQVNGIMTQHYSLAPVPLTDTIGKLIFTAYLSPVDSTNLEPMKFSFRNALSLSPDCIATLGDSGSTFTYVPSCGDNLLQSVLRSQQIHIDRIVPNPAKDIVRIEGSNLTSLDVYDVMGRQVFLPQAASMGGVQLDIRDLAAGMYYLRVGNSTSRFVIER